MTWVSGMRGLSRISDGFSVAYRGSAVHATIAGVAE
jgi:hypothetical protein